MREYSMMNCERLFVSGLVLFLFIILWAPERSLASNVSLSLPGCNQTCGNITIPYPFGMGTGCFKEDWYEIVCVSSSTPFLQKAQLQVLSISLPLPGDSAGSMLVRSPVASSGCPGKQPAKSLNLSGSNFFLSHDHNLFIVVGCNTNASMSGIYPQTVGCSSTCDPHSYNNNNAVQNGFKFCYISIPSYLQVFEAQILPVRHDKSPEEDCQLAFIADHDSIFGEETVYPDITSYAMKLRDLKRLQRKDCVPVRLDWYIGGHESHTENCNTILRLDEFGGENSSCRCPDGYGGNPYIASGGCQDIDECEVDYARGNILCGSGSICVNTEGRFRCERKKTSMIVLGAVIGVSVTLFPLVIWRLLKYLKNKKMKNTRRNFFELNRGLYLQQQLATAAEGEVEQQTRIFTAKELEKATDKFNENRILGHGGQGTVYKGMLEDGRVVAIKRANAFDRENVKEFINEVVVLSKINHRNIVKLFGCCLETDVPMLVCELVPNGNLFQNLHKESHEFPMTWEIRFRIVREVAGAIFYLHSFTNVPVYHRDVKSTNILMDGNYRAKLSDFGISRSVSMDKTHLTTRVQGTFGYLDPDYYRLSQLTEKSDVYSFGVVLVELLTGEKPVSRDSENQFVSLSMMFIESMEENGILEILDRRLKGRCNEEEVVSVANLARKCLNMNATSRPTMREVVMELERIRPAQNGSQLWNQTDQEIEEFAISIPDYDEALCSLFVSLDDDPLVMHRL